MLRILSLFIFVLSVTGNGNYYGSNSAQFHPSGRILTTEHAKNVVSTKGGPICAVKCKDGIILCASRRVHPSSLMAKAPQKIFHVDRHITIAVSGYVYESAEIIKLAMKICSEYRQIYAAPIPVENLSERIADYLHQFTCSVQSVTPSVAMIVCGWDDELGPQIYSIDPEGSAKGWNAVALGSESSRIMHQLAQLVDENETNGSPAKATGTVGTQNSKNYDSMDKVWPRFKGRVLRKFFKNHHVDDGDQANGADNFDWSGSDDTKDSHEKKQWYTEVYSCLKASTGEICWSQVHE